MRNVDSVDAKLASLQAKAQEQAQVRERALLTRADEQWRLLSQSSPDYFAYMEDAHPMLASRADLTDLMERAPNDAVFMYLFANFSMRLELAAITGREFD